MAELGEAANKAAATGVAYPDNFMSRGTHDGETFSAGDIIRVTNDGGTFFGRFTTPSSGESGNHIIYNFDSDVVCCGGALVTDWTVYGDAEDNIWQATVTPEVHDVWLDDVEGTEQASAAACTAEGYWYWASSVLYLYSDTDPDTAYTDPGVLAADSWRERPVYVYGQSYITLIGNGATVKQSRMSGIYVRSLTNEVHDVTIEDFEIHNIREGHAGANYAIQAQNVSSNLIIRKINAHHCRWNGFSIGALFGTGYALSDYLIEDCWVHHNDHNGIDNHVVPAGGTLQNVIIRNNRCHDNDNNGIYLRNESSTGTVSNSVVYSNISYSNGSHGINLDAQGSSNRPDDCVVVNNTCVGNGTDAVMNYGAGINMDSNNGICKNNICYNNSINGTYDRQISVLSSDDSIVVDYNLAWADSGTDFYRESGHDYTHAEYQATGQQLHGLSEDPKFADADNDDYTLASDSPCVGAGETLGAAYDDGLMTSSTWPTGVVTGDRDDY